MDVHEDAVNIKKKRLFELFTVDEIESVLVQLYRLREQWPHHRDDELLMYELLAVTKIK